MYTHIFLSEAGFFIALCSICGQVEPPNHAEKKTKYR